MIPRNQRNFSFMFVHQKEPEWDSDSLVTVGRLPLAAMLAVFSLQPELSVACQTFGEKETKGTKDSISSWRISSWWGVSGWKTKRRNLLTQIGQDGDLIFPVRSFQAEPATVTNHSEFSGKWLYLSKYQGLLSPLNKLTNKILAWKKIATCPLTTCALSLCMQLPIL